MIKRDLFLGVIFLGVFSRLFAQELNREPNSVGDSVGIKELSQSDTTKRMSVSEVSDIDKMRDEVRSLRNEAEKLGRMAERLDDEADDLESNIEDLYEKAETIEKKVDLIVDLSDSGNGISDSSEIGPVDGFLDQQRKTIQALRDNANALAQKARQIALKVRMMEDMADERSESADDLEEKADQLEEEQDSIPSQIRFPFQVGFQHRFFAVSPYDDNDPHFLIFGGFNFAYHLTQYFNIGVKDIMLYFSKTIYGIRSAVSVAPAISCSYTFARRYQVGGEIGAAIQGQAGAGKSNDYSIVPFVSVFNENWVSRRFSLGPSVSFNYVARGNCFVWAIPFNKPNVLPRKSGWVDCGISTRFHF